MPRPLPASAISASASVTEATSSVSPDAGLSRTSIQPRFGVAVPSTVKSTTLTGPWNSLTFDQVPGVMCAMTLPVSNAPAMR